MARCSLWMRNWCQHLCFNKMIFLDYLLLLDFLITNHTNILKDFYKVTIIQYIFVYKVLSIFTHTAAGQTMWHKHSGWEFENIILTHQDRISHFWHLRILTRLSTTHDVSLMQWFAMETALVNKEVMKFEAILRKMQWMGGANRQGICYKQEFCLIGRHSRKPLRTVCS